MEEKMFNELKAQCKEVRKKYKDRPGDYYEEKIRYVDKYGKDPKDYFIIINMFDTANLRDLYNRLSPECKEYYKSYFENFFDVLKIMGA